MNWIKMSNEMPDENVPVIIYMGKHKGHRVYIEGKFMPKGSFEQAIGVSPQVTSDAPDDGFYWTKK